MLPRSITTFSFASGTSRSVQAILTMINLARRDPLGDGSLDLSNDKHVGLSADIDVEYIFDFIDLFYLVDHVKPRVQRELILSSTWKNSYTSLDWQVAPQEHVAHFFLFSATMCSRTTDNYLETYDNDLHDRLLSKYFYNMFTTSRMHAFRALVLRLLSDITSKKHRYARQMKPCSSMYCMLCFDATVLTRMDFTHISLVTLRCILFYFCVLDSSVIEEVLGIMIGGHLLCGLSLLQFLDIGKELTILAKKCRTKFSNHWRMFVNIENFVGYNAAMTIDDKIDVVSAWGKGRKIQGKILGDDYDTLLYDCIFSLLDENIHVVHILPLSLSDYIRSPSLWVTTGSGSVNLRFEFGGESFKSGNRSAFAYSRSASAIEAMINDLDHVQPLKPAIKIELGYKGRVFISAGEVLQILMGYVSYWLEAALKGSEFSTLFMNAKQMFKMWTDVIDDCKQDLVHIPVDAADFDQEVGSNELDSTFRAIKKVIRNRSPIEMRADLLMAMDKIVFIFWKQHLIYRTRKTTTEAAKPELPKDKVPTQLIDFIWEHGVPSGIRWTALLDTLVNVGRLRVLQNLIQELVPSFRFHRYVGQGDDLLIVLRQLMAALVLFRLYNLMGWKAHPRKNFVAMDVTEYLRRTVNKDRVVGYLARRIPGAIYRSPTQSPELPGRSRVYQRLDGLNILIQRGANAKLLLSKVPYIVYHSFEQLIPMPIIRSLLQSPASCDGLGVHTRVELLYALVQREMESSDLRVAIRGVFSDHVVWFGDKLGLDLRNVLGGYETQILQRLIPEHFRRLQYKGIEVKELDMIGRVRSDLADLYMVMQSKSRVPVWHSILPLDPQIATELAIQYILAKDFVSFASICHPDCLATASLVVKNWSRSLAIEWVKGTEFFKAPVVLGFSSLSISVVHRFFSALQFKYMLSRHRVERRNAVMHAMEAECSTR